MIPYGHQTIEDDDIESVVKVLKSDRLTQGRKVDEFEKALAKYCGAKYAVAVSSGTAALHLAYLVGGIKQGDEVITSPNTFVATTNMLLVCGAKPVFADIRLDTYNIDEAKIESLITKKTRAIVPVHFAGHPCEMDKIIYLSKKYKLMVIEDACQALGASYKKRKIGSLDTDMTVFSFHPVKAITTGEGGAIVTDNKKFFDRLKLLRSHGVTKDSKGFNMMTELGYNYRLTEIQSALGMSQIKKLDRFLTKRHQIVSWYQKELMNFDRIIIPTELDGVYAGWHLYVIRTKDPDDRIKLMTFLKNNGVGVNFHHTAVYSNPYYRQNGYGNTKLQNMDHYQNTGITLPCFPTLRLEEVKFVIGKIKEFFNNA